MKKKSKVLITRISAILSIILVSALMGKFTYAATQSSPSFNRQDVYESQEDGLLTTDELRSGSFPIQQSSGLPSVGTPTKLKWSTEVPGQISWDGVLEAEGRYTITYFKDGEPFLTSNWSGLIATKPHVKFYNEIFESGSYTFTVQARGVDGKSTDGKVSKVSAPYSYKKPKAVLAKPTGLKWNGDTVTWKAVDKADGYKINLLRDGRNSYAVWWDRENGGSKTEEDISANLNIAGIYTFKVRALSSNIEKVANGDYSNESSPYTQGDVKSITIKIAPNKGGTVTGAGPYKLNDLVTVVAKPSSGYVFDGWYENNVKISAAKATYTFAATKSRTLEARFTTNSAIKLNASSKTLAPTKSTTLKAIIASKTTPLPTIAWSSSNKKVATVNNKGKVTAVAPGKTTITAKLPDGTKAVCYITVKPVAITKVTLNKTKVTIKIDQSATLTTKITPTNATDQVLKWSSSDAKIATVNQKGKVTGKKAGTATITVKSSDGNKKATCKLTVNEK